MEPWFVFFSLTEAYYLVAHSPGVFTRQLSGTHARHVVCGMSFVQGKRKRRERHVVLSSPMFAQLPTLRAELSLAGDISCRFVQ